MRNLSGEGTKQEILQFLRKLYYDSRNAIKTFSSLVDYEE